MHSHVSPTSLRPSISDGVATPALSGRKVGEAYGEWLADCYPWQWFCTFTNRKPTHPETMLKAGWHWLHRIDRHISGRRPKLGDRTVAVFAVERHQSGNPHMHGIFYHHRDLNQLAMRRHWQKVWMDPPDPRLPKWQQAMHMGWAKVEKPRSVDGASRYCSKYLSKEGELEFSGSFGIHLVQNNLKL